MSDRYKLLSIGIAYRCQILDFGFLNISEKYVTNVSGFIKLRSYDISKYIYIYIKRRKRRRRKSKKRKKKKKKHQRGEPTTKTRICSYIEMFHLSNKGHSHITVNVMVRFTIHTSNKQLLVMRVKGKGDRQKQVHR